MLLIGLFCKTLMHNIQLHAVEWLYDKTEEKILSWKTGFSWSITEFVEQGLHKSCHHIEACFTCLLQKHTVVHQCWGQGSRQSCPQAAWAMGTERGPALGHQMNPWLMWGHMSVPVPKTSVRYWSTRTVLMKITRCGFLSRTWMSTSPVEFARDTCMKPPLSLSVCTHVSFVSFVNYSVLSVSMVFFFLSIF